MAQDADVWGEAAARHLDQPPLGWLDSEWVVRERAYPCVFGRDVPGGWWSQEAMQLLGVPIGGRWLDLGCGGGGAEVAMATNGLFDHMDAFDPSSGAIDVARKQAAEAGVDFLVFDVADINSIELPAATYDVAHINMALHHVLELEHVVAQINRSLKPGGYFIANEFVGPSQFQFSPERMERVRELLAGLPDRLKWNPVAKETKTAQPRYSRAWWNDYDPTEAVRADEIDAVLRLNFPSVERHDYGGNLLNLALENVVQNFDFDAPEDVALMRDLFAAEDKWLERESSDFTYFVCRRGSDDDIRRGLEVARERHGTYRAPRDFASGAADMAASATIDVDRSSGSERPVVGRAITAAKRGIRRALGWYVEPAFRQQTEHNRAVLGALDGLHETTSARIERLELLVEAQQAELERLRKQQP